MHLYVKHGKSITPFSSKNYVNITLHQNDKFQNQISLKLFLYGVKEFAHATFVIEHSQK